MKTASFLAYIGPGRISIARRAPRTLEPGYRVYRPLAPGPWFNSVGYERYCELYDDQLVRLSSRVVWDELHKLAAPHEPVLLCWERPPFALPSAADPKGNWCHRTMVAAWFKRELGEILTEVERSCHGQHP
jgi:hypothetical protein